MEAGEGQAHGRGFGVDAVERPMRTVSLCSKARAFSAASTRSRPGEQQVGGADELDVERGVEHVRRGHALVDEARLLAAHDLGQVGQEGDDVVLGHRLDLVDAGDVEFHVLGLPDGLGILAGDHAEVGHRVAGMGLDLEPDAELGLGRPDGDHLGAGIARDHRSLLNWVAADRPAGQGPQAGCGVAPGIGARRGISVSENRQRAGCANCAAP
jgi:hypothetical protein